MSKEIGSKVKKIVADHLGVDEEKVVDFVLETFASSIFSPILKNKIPPAILKACIVIA